MKQDWKLLADSENGVFFEGHHGNSDRVEFEYKSWIIILDNFTHYATSGGKSFEDSVTRIYCTIQSKDDFQFVLRKQNLLSDISSFFGSQDVLIGDESFDKSFVVKTNHERKIKNLLEKYIRSEMLNLRLRNLQTTKQKGLWQETLPDKQYDLISYLDSEENELHYLMEIKKLFEKVLDQLKLMDAIS